MVQASAMFVVLTATAGVLAGILAGVLGLLAGLLAAALLVLAGLVVLAALLVLSATLVLAALLAGIIGVLIHHLLSCCPCHTIKLIAKQRFQSRQYQHP
jgi:hypothetical protein